MSNGSAGVLLGIYEKALPRCSSWGEFFAQAGHAEFDFVDLSVDESAERSARLGWSAAQRVDIRRAAAESGVRIGGICLSLHRRVMPGSADPSVRADAVKVFRQGIRLAADLGASVLQVAGYYAYYEPPDPRARDRYLDTLLAAVPHAAREGVILGLENIDGGDIDSIPEALRIADEAASPWLQLYPDIGNIAERGGDVTAQLRAGAGRILALHVKDAVPGAPRRIDFGAGDAEFDAAFAELHRQSWSGRIMLEMWNDDAADALDRCSRARDFVTGKLTDAGIDVVDGRHGRAGRRQREELLSIGDGRGVAAGRPGNLSGRRAG